MTERAFPLGTPTPRRVETSPAPHLRALPADPRALSTSIPTARAASRTATVTRRPIHVAVTVGMTASLYAVSLAGVTALQHDSDARLAADRAPASAAVEALRSANDAMDTNVAGLGSGLSGASATYRAVADRIGAHEADLVALGTRVAAVEGSASSLRVPAIPRLPALPSRTVVVTAKPVSNACTTASGKPC